MAGQPQLTHPWLVVVVAQQRSGTTAFGRTLNQGSKIKSFGEVFHNARSTSKVNYFNHREHLIKDQPWLSFTTTENQQQLWTSYLALLRSKAEKPFVLIDAKYNSWHHFNGVWYLTGEAPAMVHLVRKSQAKVIHIIRRNVFAQACSAILAEQRQEFHFAETPAVEPNSLRLNPRGVLARMKRSSLQTEQFRRFFSGYAPYRELFYEELFDGKRIATTGLEAVSELIGEDCDGQGDLPLAKATPSLDSLIGNADEIEEFFRTTSFGEMVSNALRPG